MYHLLFTVVTKSKLHLLYLLTTMSECRADSANASESVRRTSTAHKSRDRAGEAMNPMYMIA